MNITAKTKLCMVIGDPVDGSLSPQIQNAGYERLGIDGDFVFVASRVSPEDLADFVSGARAMGLRGFGCRMPHKLEVMQYLDDIDDVAKAIGAVNTVVNDNGRLKGYNADWIGIVAPLEALTTLKDKKVGLLGAGGAARAAAYGVTAKGAELTIYNRTLDKAQALAEQFGATAKSLDELKSIKSMDIIINATSVGMSKTADETPLPKSLLTKDHIVFDIVYEAGDTRLAIEAKDCGAQFIPGTEMLLHQGMAQFKLFTGYEAPEEAMRNVLMALLSTTEGK